MTNGFIIAYCFAAVPFIIALVPIKRQKGLEWSKSFYSDSSMSPAGYLAIQRGLKEKSNS